MRGIRLYAIVAATFMAGAFLASPELRAYAIATISSADIVNETIRSEDIKDGQIKAADIAANAVGASEIRGVSKLLFTECTVTNNGPSSPGANFIFSCIVPEAEGGDNAIATITGADNTCFAVTRVLTFDQRVSVGVTNVCITNMAPGTMEFSVLVYKT